jgi:transcriptional regulator with XRE-family HTH domain
MNQEKIGKIIKDIRIKHNLSQKDLATKYGVTYQAVSKWENGKNIPDISLLKQICEDFNLDINELLSGSAKKDSKKKFRNIIIVGIMVVLLGVLVSFLFLKPNKDNITLSNISSSCEDFIVTGSVAYNSKKGVISITGVDYCGKDFLREYEKIECVLNESSNGSVQELGRVESNKKMDLKAFLNTVKFNVNNYIKSCQRYDDSNLFLTINLTTDKHTIISHRVSLKLDDICN